MNTEGYAGKTQAGNHCRQVEKGVNYMKPKVRKGRRLFCRLNTHTHTHILTQRGKE